MDKYQLLGFWPWFLFSFGGNENVKDLAALFY